MIKSHEKKWQNYFYETAITAILWNFKTYYGSVKKNKLSFSCHLYIDKKSNNLKEDPRRKNDSDFDFSQAT